MGRTDFKFTSIRRAATAIGRGLTYLLGRPAWQPPPWATATGRVAARAWRWARNDRARALALLATVLLTVGGGVALLRWWDHRPKPQTIAVRVVVPELTKIDDKVRPRPLRIEFDDSVAPLDKISRPVTSGITLVADGGGMLAGLARRPGEAQPVVPTGSWQWISDRELSFAPKTDWPVGQAFTIQIAKNGLLAGHVRLQHYQLPFKTAGFEARIAEVTFYQDPVNANLKKVVTTVRFSHPVDPATFEKQVKLRLVPTDKEEAPSEYQAHITYDKWKGAAFIHSGPLTVPRHDATFWVTLAPGTRAARGGPADTRKLEDKVVVPGLFNLLKVRSADLTQVDNDRYEPEQALIVETSVGVAAREIAKSLRVTLLPERVVGGKPSRWTDPAALGPSELKGGMVLALSPIASEAEFPVAHSFKINAPVGRQLYVTVGKGLRSFGGYVLGETFQSIVEVRPFPQMLRILQNGALLATSGDRKLPVLTRDIPAVKYEIGRVLPGQIHHLVSQSLGDFAHPAWVYSFDQTNLTEVFEETHRLKAIPGKPEYDSVDLSKYITGTGDERRGLFLLRAQSWDPEKRQALGAADNRLVLVSDLGVLVKQNADGSHEVFVESIRSGEPVAGAHVEVLGKNGQRVLEANTDASGHAHLGSFVLLHREKEPTLYLVSTAKDQSFLPVGRADRQLDTSRFDVGGVSEDATTGIAKGLTAYLFTDRGLYRPGDDIRVGLVVKNRDWSGRLAGLPLQVVITDARGLPVKDQKLKLRASGFEEIQHTTPEIAPAGTYAVNVYVVKDEHQSSLLGSTTFTVREFLPDRMKIHAALSRENPQGWVSPGELKVHVALANLFGTAAANRQVRTKMTLSPWIPAFAHLRDYRFFDPLRPREGVSENLADTTTNEAGEADVDLGLQRFANATYRLSVTTEGLEAGGGRSVVADVAAVVSPLPFLIGYKTDGELSYLSRGTDRQVELIAVAPTGRRMAATALQAVLFERKFVSVLARQERGTYRYQSVKKDVELSAKPFEIGATGSKRKLPTDRPGDFTLAIRDGKGQILQRIDFAVSGYGNLSRDVEKNAELQIALKQADVAPGDELEMQIKAPYTGTALITIERDRVYAWKWFKTTTTATVERIRVPPELEGGGYVSVAFVRDPASEEIFMSPLSHGIAPFSISRARRQVKLQVDTPELARPGEPFRMTVKTDKASQVVVFAVDEGILRVANFKTPDPLGFFFQKKALSVRTSQILDLILPEFQRLLATAAPGGDAEGSLGANLNPFRRKQQKPVAYWSGIVDVGPKPRELVYDVPESFNGTLRVMAVAVAPDALGAFEHRAVVRGDFVISPNVPPFLAPGDESTISVSVANNVVGSGKAAVVTLDVAASSGLEVMDGGKRTVTVAEMREGSTSFRVRARSPVGPATLTLTARMGAAHAHLTTPLSVRPAVPFLATFQAGHLQDREVTVPVARRLYGELRRVEAGLSPLPLGLTHGLRGYLEKFPHGCTEQLVSQAVPSLVLAAHPEFGYSPKTASAAVEQWIAQLRTRQNDEGAFGRWAANPEVDAQASIWAAHMLLEAREHGYSVPGDMVKRSTTYLQSFAAVEAEGPNADAARAYATYVLTRGGMMTGAFAAAQEKHLQANDPKGWRRSLAALYLAATYRLLKQERPARDIIDAIQFGQARPADEAWYYDRLAHDAQSLYIIARHFPERSERVTPREIDALVDPIFRGSYNTYSSAWTILGLEAYGRTATAAAASHGTLTAQEIVGGKPRPLALPQSLLPIVPLSPHTTAVRFEANGPLGAYWVLAEAGFDLDAPDKAQSHSLEIARTFEDAQGKPVSAVKLGDEITAVLRIRTIGKPAVNHLAIVDLLLGGFEPVVQTGLGRQASSSPAPQHDEADQGVVEHDQEDPGESEGEEESAAGETVQPTVPVALSIALPGATLPLEFADVREDRVVLYGSAGAEAKELKYVIKATNVGSYSVPPAQVSALYDSTVYARAAGGGKLTVNPR